jgi:hypothetical protein
VRGRDRQGRQRKCGRALEIRERYAGDQGGNSSLNESTQEEMVFARVQDSVVSGRILPSRLRGVLPDDHHDSKENSSELLESYVASRTASMSVVFSANLHATAGSFGGRDGAVCSPGENE